MPSSRSLVASEPLTASVPPVAAAAASSGIGASNPKCIEFAVVSTILVRLKKGREKALRQGHPWLFSGAIGGVEGPADASLARVESASGRFLGIGFHSPHSQIRVRVVRRSEGAVDRAFFRERLAAAIELRGSILPPDTDGYRVLNAEGDGLPGWTVDRFGDVLVSQITSAGLEAIREEAYGALADYFPDHAILQTNPAARRQEGLAAGGDETILGQPPERSRFQESGVHLSAELGGQKTGFYLDQRPSRRLVETLAGNRRILDLFAHSGAFTAYALRGGAETSTAVESSGRLLERGQEHLRWNDLDEDRARWVKGNVFEFLRETDERFDLVICDPPPLARRRGQMKAGSRAYKDLNRLALSRVESGGFLLTFSCSGAVDSRLFRQILFSASLEAGVTVRLLRPLSAGADHPVDLAHPQGEYLKGWLVEVRR